MQKSNSNNSRKRALKKLCKGYDYETSLYKDELLRATTKNFDRKEIEEELQEYYK